MRTISKRIWISTVLLAALAAPLAANQALEPKYEATRELMATVRDAAELVTAEGLDAACARFRVKDSRWYQGDDYVFVLAMDGEALCHPARPSLEGRNLMDLHDPRGRPIAVLMLRELETADVGWVHYLWPRPDERIFEWKTTHVRRALDPGGRELMIASGRYQMEMEPFFVAEQVEDAIELIRARGTGEAFAALRDKASGFLFYNAYVFVLDESGTLLVNNAFPENEGKDMSDLEDRDGKPFVREMRPSRPTCATSRSTASGCSSARGSTSSTSRRCARCRLNPQSSDRIHVGLDQRDRPIDPPQAAFPAEDLEDLEHAEADRLAGDRYPQGVDHLAQLDAALLDIVAQQGLERGGLEGLGRGQPVAEAGQQLGGLGRLAQPLLERLLVVG
jgi:hypothetical protein